MRFHVATHIPPTLILQFRYASMSLLLHLLRTFLVTPVGIIRDNRVPLRLQPFVYTDRLRLGLDLFLECSVENLLRRGLTMNQEDSADQL